MIEAGTEAESLAQPGNGDPLDVLVRDLRAAKTQLSLRSDAAREVELRTRGWDPTSPFNARRGQSLRDEARNAFLCELESVHELLAGHLIAIDDAIEVGAERRSVLLALRRELRTLQQTFAQTSPLLMAVVQQLGAAL